MSCGLPPAESSAKPVNPENLNSSISVPLLTKNIVLFESPDTGLISVFL